MMPAASEARIIAKGRPGTGSEKKAAIEPAENARPATWGQDRPREAVVSTRKVPRARNVAIAPCAEEPQGIVSKPVDEERRDAARRQPDDTLRERKRRKSDRRLDAAGGPEERKGETACQDARESPRGLHRSLRVTPGCLRRWVVCALRCRKDPKGPTRDDRPSGHPPLPQPDTAGWHCISSCSE